MKYLLVAKSEADPATRYRVNPVVRLLRQRNDDVEVCYEPNWFQQLGLIGRAASADLLFVQRKLMNPIVVRMMSLFARHIVFDHDDAIFLKSSGQPSSTRSRRYLSMVQASDLVLAGNSYLRQTAIEYGGRAEVVPTAVDIGRYAVDGNKSDQPTLVWIGSRSTSRYLEQHRTMFEALAKRLPNIRLRIVGDFSFSVPGLEVECIDWSESGEVEALASADIGIAPMTDDPWTRGKCALKIIQYMAAGLPVVSSDVGANSEVVRDNETGYLVSSTDAWIDAIEKLVRSAELRTTLGAAGRVIAESEYSQQVTAARVIDLMDAVTAR